MKNIRFTEHALEQCNERGASEDEVKKTILNGIREDAKKGREQCKLNFQFKSLWNDQYYSIKQVVAIIIEENDEIIVITVYTFYF